MSTSNEEAVRELAKEKRRLINLNKLVKKKQDELQNIKSLIPLCEGRIKEFKRILDQNRSSIPTSRDESGRFSSTFANNEERNEARKLSRRNYWARRQQRLASQEIGASASSNTTQTLATASSMSNVIDTASAPSSPSTTVIPPSTSNTRSSARLQKKMEFGVAEARNLQVTLELADIADALPKFVEENTSCARCRSIFIAPTENLQNIAANEDARKQKWWTCVFCSRVFEEKCLSGSERIHPVALVCRNCSAQQLIRTDKLNI